MSEGRISIQYVVNSSEFNSNISQMKKNMQLCNQEIKNSAKEIQLYGTNIQTLSSKQKAIQDAINQSNKIMKSYSDNIEKNKKALVENTSELERLAAKKKEANKAYKDAVKNYGEESDEAKKLKKSLQDVSDEYNIMQSRVKGNEKAITNGTAQMEKQRGVLLDLQNELKNVNKALEEQSNKFIQASKRFAELGTNLEKMGGKLKNLGSEVQQAGALIVGAASAIGMMAAQFETAMAKVNSIAKYNTEDLNKMSDEIINLSNETGQSASDVAEAVYQAISASVDADKAVSFVQSANKLATGGFTDVTKAVDILTTAINAYGLSADDAGNISDKLIQTQNLGKTSVDDLASSMGKIIPTAKAYNVNIDQICTGYAEMTASGIATAEATTYMNSMLNELGKSGTTVADLLKNKTGKTFQELMSEGKSLGDVMKILSDGASETGVQFTELWSSQEAGKAGLSLLTDEGSKFNGILKEMQNSAGATDEAFETMANTSEFKFKKSLNEAKNSAIKLGESLLPLLDDVSKGISDLAKFISKLNPETVTAIAKFGAMTLVIGTLIKGVGSLVTIAGKGATALSALFKIAANTKALGSLTKALAESDTAIGGIIKSAGGLSKVFSGFSLTGGLIGGAVAGIAALGVAFYNNQKEIEESEAKLAEMADCYDDFTGRIRTNESIWTEIFGKKYEIVFGSDYKQALANTESDVAEWVEKLRGMQNDINALLNDTSKSDETKQKELEQMVQLTPENNNKQEHEANFRSQLSEKNITGAAQDKLVQQWSDAYDQAQQIIDNGEKKIAEIIKNNLDAEGNITEEGMEKIKQVREDVQDEIAQVQSDDVDTQLAMAESYVAQEQLIYKGAEKGTVEAYRNKYKSMQDERIKDLENQKEYIDGLDTLSAAEKAALKDNINEQIVSLTAIEVAQEASLSRRAMYDQEYAKQNGLAVQQINDNMWTVIDTNTGIETSFFETEAAMQQYADTMGLQTSYVADEFGNMHMVIQDAGGGIMAMVDSTTTSFGFFGNEAYAAMQQVIDQAGVTQGTSEQRFAAICAAIDNGTLSAQEFGMTDQEFYRTARAMAEGSSDAQDLSNKLKSIPKSTTAKVETKIEGESALDDFIDKIGSFAGKVFTATVNVATQGIDAIKGILGNKETGGTIQESGIYNVNEAGTELIDSFGTSTASNYSLGAAVQGEYAYLSQGTKITNALMTTQKMNDMVNSRVDARFSNIDKRLDRLCTVLEKHGINTSNGVNVNMYDPHFENKGSENANISNIKRIVNSMK